MLVSGSFVFIMVITFLFQNERYKEMHMQGRVLRNDRQRI